MLGSEFFPQWKNGILFLEETAEEPYKLDRMLTHLKLAGVFDRLNGIVFGKCSKCEAEEPEKAFTYQQVIEMHLKEINVPSFYNSMIGHVENKYTLPIGIEVEIDADKGIITTTEAAVS
jgi:muramoyltetrapeptide carboxypeptidase